MSLCVCKMVYDRNQRDDIDNDDDNDYDDDDDDGVLLINIFPIIEQTSV